MAAVCSGTPRSPAVALQSPPGPSLQAPTAIGPGRVVPSHGETGTETGCSDHAPAAVGSARGWAVFSGSVGVKVASPGPVMVKVVSSGAVLVRNASLGSVEKRANVHWIVMLIVETPGSANGMVTFHWIVMVMDASLGSVDGKVGSLGSVAESVPPGFVEEMAAFSGFVKGTVHSPDLAEERGTSFGCEEEKLGVHCSVKRRMASLGCMPVKSPSTAATGWVGPPPAGCPRLEEPVDVGRSRADSVGAAALPVLARARPAGSAGVAASPSSASVDDPPVSLYSDFAAAGSGGPPARVLRETGHRRTGLALQSQPACSTAEGVSAAEH